MDTAWIQVFVLTLTECLAPAGKTVCQEQELQMQFMNQQDCELAREQLVLLIEQTENSIINRDRTQCSASASEHRVFASLDEIKQSGTIDENWDTSEAEALPAPDFTLVAHQKRLAELPACADVGGAAPCKIGEIIIEGASEQSADIWQRD